MKYDFKNSLYAKFWESRDAQNALQVFLNNPELFEQNYTFWRSQFSVDPYTQPRANDGTATFKTIVKKREEAGLLNMRAPLGDAVPRDKEGIEFYTGSIPDFIADAFVETAMERETKERMFDEYFGNDATIVSVFADRVQLLIDEGNQTMSNLAAQLLSKGNMVVHFGKGIHSPVGSAPIPQENFIKAGAKAWTDPECELISQMTDIEEKYRRDHNLENASLKWQIPRKMFFNVFLKNKQVIEYVKAWCTINEKVFLDSMTLTEDLYRLAFANQELISPIELIEEKQKDGTNGYVHGWEEGIVVLRPAGPAGVVKRASILDTLMWRKYGNNAISKVFATTSIFTLVNSVIPNGMYKEWHTDLMVSAIPTLEEFLYHLIIDTTRADS